MTKEPSIRCRGGDVENICYVAHKLSAKGINWTIFAYLQKVALFLIFWHKVILRSFRILHWNQHQTFTWSFKIGFAWGFQRIFNNDRYHKKKKQKNTKSNDQIVHLWFKKCNFSLTAVRKISLPSASVPLSLMILDLTVNNNSLRGC